MLILILVLAIVTLIILLMYPSIYIKTIGKNSYYDSFKFRPLRKISLGVGVFIIGMITAICVVSFNVSTISALDEKISMYQEENQKIEEDVNIIVREYLKYEHDTFSDLDNEESLITLVDLFPELKADTLVQKQLEVYINNNSSIKHLKSKKIDINKLKWLLYFGK